MFYFISRLLFSFTQDKDIHHQLLILLDYIFVRRKAEVAILLGKKNFSYSFAGYTGRATRFSIQCCALILLMAAKKHIKSVFTHLG